MTAREADDDVVDHGAVEDARSTDRGLLGVYLNDHLAGSVAGSQRFQRLARTLHRTPVGADLANIAEEVTEEREELRAVIEGLDVRPQDLLKQAAAWVGERLARLKASRREVASSTTRTLLEVELLRSALVGKLGVWQTLEDLAGDLGLDRDRMAELRRRTQEQVRTMDDVHAYVRGRALRGA
ncbi:hypothetical protein [Cellulomonas carbonis]|uniref:Uncharacterized protein n=1 Tax=Cellulomonas carbonis T26 TaxID=947969 RepID=A0A0A0BVY0_9CELL|nr:hypothetical protein [Cellulomonas carbonis]KGM12130.1 hypothetical protein N868_01790 [Cellulomonas carbonis T26]GGB97254.1 hypothetical protein GCM10010972_07520 [Cellulomonas carbonis]